jgi:SAM-dependent methyltransferase
MFHSTFEKDFVHDVYNNISQEFHQTRYCYWNAIQNFLQGLPKYSLVLDNGCGNGKYLGYRKDLTFIGNDMCLPLLEICRTKADVSYANGLILPYKTNMFDAIICVAVLHHLSTPERRKQFIQEMVRVLKVNGTAMITVWAREQCHKRVAKWTIQDNGDAMIPWRDKKGNIVSQRYYHLFTQEELYSYFKNESVIILNCFFEYDNWCIHIKKSNHI